MKFSFKPKWWAILLTLLVITVFMRLSAWQYHRYVQKKAWQAQASDTTRTHGLAEFTDQAKARLNYQHLSISGHFIDGHDLLLDNQTHQGRVGYHVISLFLPDGEQQALLVDRGWVAAPPSRSILPTISPLTPQSQVAGIVKYLPKKSFTLGKVGSEKITWPKRIQVMDIPFIQQITGTTVHPFVLLLAPKLSNGFVREWRVGGISATRHLGYAVQWLAMAVALLAIFIGVNLRRVNSC